MAVSINKRVNSLNISKPVPHNFFTKSTHRIWCLAKFELIRLFLTKRGGLALAAFATAWFLILYYLISSAVTLVSSDMFKDMAQQVFGMLGLSTLLKWKIPELAIYWLVAIYTFPIFSLFAASDQTCSDRDRGTLRFISLRATRNEIVFGRFLGQVLIIAILIAITLIATTLMASYREPSLFIDALIKSITVFRDLTLATLPFIAFMAFINSFISSARLAIVNSMLFFGLAPMLITLISYKLTSASHLHYLIPGMQLSEMVGQEQFILANYLTPSLQTLFYLVVATLIMRRSAL
jgi:Cu-processing system permease protein